MCVHEFWERESAVADGMCPLCLSSMLRLTERRLEASERLRTGLVEACQQAYAETAVAWSICASIHREYAKGKDPFFKTRQADFTKHENDARAKITSDDAAELPESSSQSAGPRET